MTKIVDEYGLCLEGQHLLLYFPAHDGYLGFKVVMRENKGFEKVMYGPIPHKVTNYEDGVIPAGQVAIYKFGSHFTTEKDRIKWSYPPPATDDIFYFTEEKDKVFDVFIRIKPILLRTYIEYPTGVPQVSFREKVIVNPTNMDDFGFFRESYNMIFLPKIDVRWVSANPTNLDLRTYVDFIYAEYKVELVKEAEKIKELIEKEKAKIVTMPYFVQHAKVEELFGRILMQKPVKIS